LATESTSKPAGRFRDWLRGRRRPILWIVGVAGGLAGGAVAVLALLDWNQFRGPIADIASARTGRQVEILGDLDVRILSLRPSATVHRLEIGQPVWAGPGRMARIDRLDVQIEALPLLWGRVVLPRLEMTRPTFVLLRDRQGRVNWSDKAKAGPLRLPPIRRFVIREGRLDFSDARRRLVLKATLDASERLGAANRGFQLSGDGSINAAPFHVEIVGGPLINIDPGKPYPFDADVRAGGTRILAKGMISKPFDFGRLQAQVTARGPDLADLYDLTGVPFPNSPPYRLTGRLTRNGKLWRVPDLGGRVGDSDVGGQVSVDGSGARPFVTAELRSRQLDFDDLAAIFGGPPSTAPGETASEDQRAMDRRLTAQRRLLADATLKIERIRAVDADVTYRADHVHAERLPLRAASARIRLGRGLLVVEQLRLELAQGSVTGVARLDARGKTPVSSIDVRLTKARLEEVVSIRTGGPPPLTGALVARVKLTGTGDSVRRAAADADGEVLLVVPGGEIRRAFAELLGVNVTKGLGLLLAKDQSRTDLRCAVAHFQARDGMLTANRIIFDTGPVLGTGAGTVDLRTERIDVRLKGHPKEARLIRVIAPVTLRGPITKPEFGVETGQAVAQGGVAAALGALVAPLASILPFIDLGLAKDAACGALIAQAGREGAPVAKAPGV